MFQGDPNYEYFHGQVTAQCPQANTSFHCVLPTQLLLVNQHNREKCNRSASCSDSWAYFLLEPLWISEWQVMFYVHSSVLDASGVLQQALLLRFFDQVDLTLSEAFCKLVLDQSDSFTVDDLKVLDSHVETV